jgi:hypothetical protein
VTGAASNEIHWAMPSHSWFDSHAEMAGAVNCFGDSRSCRGHTYASTAVYLTERTHAYTYMWCRWENTSQRGGNWRVMVAVVVVAVDVVVVVDVVSVVVVMVAVGF